MLRHVDDSQCDKYFTPGTRREVRSKLHFANTFPVASTGDPNRKSFSLRRHHYDLHLASIVNSVPSYSNTVDLINQFFRFEGQFLNFRTTPAHPASKEAVGSKSVGTLLTPVVLTALTG